MLSVLINKVQLQDEENVEGDIVKVKVEVQTQFALLRIAVYSIASQKRAEERIGVVTSSLSLSIYDSNRKAI